MSNMGNKNNMLNYQFQMPSLKGSDFFKEQGPKFSILHWASLEIVSTFESAITLCVGSLKLEIDETIFL